MDKDELPRKREDTEKLPEEVKGLSVGTKFITLPVIIIGALLLSAGVIVPDFIPIGPGRSLCSYAVQDAKNVPASLASYFSEPENIRMPTVEILISDADLSLNNPVENVILFPEPGESAESQPISVTVIDNTERCPRNNAYIETMGGGIAYWK